MTVKEFLEHYNQNCAPTYVVIADDEKIIEEFQGEYGVEDALPAFKELLDKHGKETIKDFRFGRQIVIFELEQEQDKRVYEIVKDILEEFENSPDDPEREGYLSDGEWLDEFYHSVTRIKAILEEEEEK